MTVQSRASSPGSPAPDAATLAPALNAPAGDRAPDTTTTTPSTRWRSPRLLGRNRDYTLMWSGQMISAVGSQVSLLALPILIFALTRSPAATGIASALRGIPYVLLMLPAGALVDRWDRRRVMLISDTGRALALGSIPVAALLGHLSVAQIYVVTLIEGTLHVFFTLAETASLPRIVSPAQLPAATAQNEFLNSASVLAGPPLEGLLFSIGSAVPFLGDAISYTASVASVFLIRTPLRSERAGERISVRQILGDVREGMVWLWRAPVIRFLAVLTSGLMLTTFGYSLVVIVRATQEHASNVTIGLIFGAGGVGAVIGAMLAAPLQRRFGFSRVMIGATWGWALTWLLFAAGNTPLLLGMANALSYVVVPIYMATQFGYRLQSIPDALQARVNSVFRLIAFGVQPISLALTGLLLQVLHPVATVWLLFVPQVVLAVAATLSRSLRGAVAPQAATRHNA
ncbi:MAG TPA: MFS transporter [Ktedonobacterales bacterium]